MLSLRCQAQNYGWGRPADTSEVAKLAQLNGCIIDESQLYAELWMGTHPNCPSLLCATGRPLADWIEAHPTCLGLKVQQRFGPCLPFLFKVLSVNKALSIQSHPDKRLAEKLNAQHPKLYPDDNHKPEMALAISDGFEALCSFRQPAAIAAQLRRTAPEVVQLLGQDTVAALEAVGAQQDPKEALQAAFSALMTAAAPSITTAIDAIVARLTARQTAGASGGDDALDPHEALVLRLNSQYPGGDVGVLASLFLNRVCLDAGQAVYLAANEPHAYLAGEIVEVMASSDNVVRAGLTPKFKDCDVLCSTLTYKPGMPEVLKGTSLPLEAAAATAATEGTTATAAIEVVASSGAALEKEVGQGGSSGSVKRAKTSHEAVTNGTSAEGSVHGFRVSLFRPPFEEFEVLRVHVDGGSSGVLPANEGPMVVLVQGGKGTMLAAGGSVPKHSCGAELQEQADVSRGCILFVPAATQLTFVAALGDEPMLVWVAAVNGIFFSLHGAVHGAEGAAAPAPAAATAVAGGVAFMKGGVAAVPSGQLQGSSMAN